MKLANRYYKIYKHTNENDYSTKREKQYLCSIKRLFLFIYFVIPVKFKF